jgi:quercetin dioxygenase-like cupin family protein
MKRVAIAALAATAFLSVTCAAIGAEPSADLQKARTVADKPIIHGADVKPIEVYEWVRDGVHHNSWPGDGQTPPYDAAKQRLQLFSLPTGSLRKVYAEKGTHTPWHPTGKQDVLFYTLTSDQVEFVDNAAVYSHPGDVSLHPEGVMHHYESVTGGYWLAIGFAPQGKSGRDLIWMQGSQHTLFDATEWVEGNQRKMAIGATDNPGAKFKVKLFQFPGYLVSELRLPKGEALPVHKNDAERILYVISGRLRMTSDTMTDEVAAGDVAREIAGKPFAREALEDSVILEIDGSKPPPPM